MNQHVTLSNSNVCPHCGAMKHPIMGVALDMMSGVVSFQGGKAELTPQRAHLMKCLIDFHPVPVDSKSLYAVIWGNRKSVTSRPENIVRVVACHLRKQLREAKCPITIKGRKSVGYWLEAT